MQIKNRALRLLHRAMGHPDLEDYVRRGMRVGRNVEVNPGVTFDWPHCWLVELGDDCIFAPGVRVLAHDASMRAHLGYTRIGRVVVGDRTFVGAGATVMPGVTIGSDVIIGAATVVTADVADGKVVVGSPGRVIGTTEDFLQRRSQERASTPVFPYRGWSMEHGISAARKDEMRSRLANHGGIGFIE